MSEFYQGNQLGELCNRNGCQGEIISKAEDGMSCSCHINPPCSKCTAGVYCPDCGWDSDEEYAARTASTKSSNNTPYWSYPTWTEKCEQAKDDELVYMVDSNDGWHSGMCYKLRYPIEMPTDNLYKKLGIDTYRGMPRLSITKTTEKFIFAKVSFFTD